MLIRLRREYGQFITSGAQLLLLLIGVHSESRRGWLISFAMASPSRTAPRSTSRPSLG